MGAERSGPAAHDKASPEAIFTIALVAILIVSVVFIIAGIVDAQHTQNEQESEIYVEATIVKIEEGGEEVREVSENSTVYVAYKISTYEFKEVAVSGTPSEMAVTMQVGDKLRLVTEKGKYDTVRYKADMVSNAHRINTKLVVGIFMFLAVAIIIVTAVVPNMVKAKRT